MAQLLPIVRKLFPNGMVGVLLTVCVLFESIADGVTLSGVAGVLLGRASGTKLAVIGGLYPGLDMALLGRCGKASLNTRTDSV